MFIRLRSCLCTRMRLAWNSRVFVVSLGRAAATSAVVFVNGICLCTRVMSVKALMVTGPSCFRCLYHMLSGPGEEVGFVCSVACFVRLWVKGGGGGSFCGRSLRCVPSIFLLTV